MGKKQKKSLGIVSYMRPLFHFFRELLPLFREFFVGAQENVQLPLNDPTSATIPMEPKRSANEETSLAARFHGFFK